MKRAGRASPLTVLGIVALLALIFLLVFSKQSPSAAAKDFMVALGKGNTAELAKLTVIGSDDLATRKKKWEKTVDRGKHYLFVYQVQDATETSDTEAAVDLIIWRNARSASTFDQRMELPMLKVDGEWKVDVGAVNRELYPSLPR